MQLSEIWCLLIWLGLSGRTFGDTTVGDIETLDEEQCSKARKGCCEDPDLFPDYLTMECMDKFMDQKSPVEEMTLAISIDSLSCVFKCIYKKLNFLVEGDEDINMQEVKEHVNKFYAGRPKEQQYHIEVFEFCRKHAFKTYTQININNKDCKSYYLFVNACRMSYHMMKTCPYFMWAAKDGTPAAQECKSAKEQCYKIDGLTPSENLSYRFALLKQ
ncbi:uncharacterized protein LOC128922562 [Zeugodacus cucurbitae]|uniref:uncharacterized protein LOC128922562 n=1 Tax=Zeugodacus cucurbitae TaxID=28588 RepID=UPI0023D91155|nr:uncharacterized protein LOC128922562 [Zeugodacus cucurbitae]